MREVPQTRALTHRGSYPDLAGGTSEAASENLLVVPTLVTIPAFFVAMYYHRCPQSLLLRLIRNHIVQSLTYVILVV